MILRLTKRNAVSVILAASLKAVKTGLLAHMLKCPRCNDISQIRGLRLGESVVGKPASSTDDKYKLQILSRALSVLFAFSPSRKTRSLDSLAAELDINKTSLLRILRTLEAERFLLRQGDGYRLGPRVLDLSNVFLSTLSVHEVAQPHMSRLAQRCNQTVSLGILDEFDVVYIAIEQAQREVGIQGEIGGRHPAHATGLGKVLLADLNDAELESLLEGRDLKRLTHRTIQNSGELQERIKRVRADGYALDDEERGIGIRCIAAPIRDHTRKVVAALSIAGPIFHMTEEVIPGYLESLREAAGLVSEALGYEEEVLSVG